MCVAVGHRCQVRLQSISELLLNAKKRNAIYVHMIGLRSLLQVPNDCFRTKLQSSSCLCSSYEYVPNQLLVANCRIELHSTLVRHKRTRMDPAHPSERCWAPWIQIVPITSTTWWKGISSRFNKYVQSRFLQLWWYDRYMEIWQIFFVSVDSRFLSCFVFFCRPQRKANGKYHPRLQPT